MTVQRRSRKALWLCSREVTVRSAVAFRFCVNASLWKNGSSNTRSIDGRSSGRALKQRCTNSRVTSLTPHPAGHSCMNCVIASECYDAGTMRQSPLVQHGRLLLQAFDHRLTTPSTTHIYSFTCAKFMMKLTVSTSVVACLGCQVFGQIRRFMDDSEDGSHNSDKQQSGWSLCTNTNNGRV